MKELLKKLIDSGRAEALENVDSLRKAAAELGYTEAQIEEALEDLSGFPLDDDDLAEIAGGYLPVPAQKNMAPRGFKR